MAAKTKARAKTERDQQPNRFSLNYRNLNFFLLCVSSHSLPSSLNHSESSSVVEYFSTFSFVLPTRPESDEQPSDCTDDECWFHIAEWQKSRRFARRKRTMGDTTFHRFELFRSQSTNIMRRSSDPTCPVTTRVPATAWKGALGVIT